MMEEEDRSPSGKYTWRIDCFSEKENDGELCSETFTVGGCKWRILVHPKGNRTDHLSVFLEVADAPMLPSGWCIDAKFALTLVDQQGGAGSIKKDFRNEFRSGSINWGNREFKALAEFLDCSKGYVVNDTVVVEVEITVQKVVPPIELATQISRLGSFFSSFSENFTSAGTPHSGDGLSSERQIIDLAADAPSAGDVEKAKQSLRDCLSDLFKLDMRDRLSSALSILSHALAGLSPDQQRSIETFKANFDDFVWDFLSFEQDNSDYELQKITRDHIYSEMKKNHETHLSYQRSLDSISKEKEELNKRLKELSSKETKLVYDWETLMNESKGVKSRYAIQEKKLAEAEEKKKVAEERMSRSTCAWSNLKEQFL